MTDISRLREFQEQVDEITKPAMHRGTDTILVFDQSLANTGWCLISGGKVTKTGNLKTEKEDKGNEDNFRRALKIFAWVNGLTFEMVPDRIVHEAPPVGGGRIRHPESSLLTAMAIRIAAELEDVPVTMLTPMAAKKRWTGNARASKAELKTALLDLHPYLSTMKPMNQAVSDAIAVGLLSMETENG